MALEHLVLVPGAVAGGTPGLKDTILMEWVHEK